MAKRKSIWEDEGSKYGTYKGNPGSPEQWASGFASVLDGSDAAREILGESYCKILDVPTGASQAEIKKAYRKLVKTCHPDHYPTKADFFRRITNAYEVLTGKSAPQIKTPPNSRRQAPDEDNLIIPQLLTPIDESEVQRYIDDPLWGAQEKMDGRHQTIQSKNGIITIRNRNGIGATGTPTINNLPIRNFLIDGETIDNHFYAWDTLEIDNVNLRPEPYTTRFNLLVAIDWPSTITICSLTTGTKDKQRLFNALKKNGKEGIVFKRLAAPFSPGKGPDQVKFKFYDTCSVIVAPGRKGKASIGMNLIDDDGQPEFVGYCTCTLYPLPAPGSIAEIKYLYAYRGGCLYQPAFLTLRDDIPTEDCTTSQLKYKA